MNEENARLFPETRWSLVSQWQHQPEVASRALGELCQTYWYPVYAYIRTLGRNHHDAQDLTQAFFAALIEREDLRKANRERGKLRTFLCMAAKRFVINEHRRDQGFRRGGQAQIISLDGEEADHRFHREPATSETPESLFEKRWAHTVIDEAIGRLTNYYELKGKKELLLAMLPYLSPHAREQAQDHVAKELGMKVNTFRMNITRMRQRYQERLRAIVADTVSSQEELEEELNYLFRLFES